MSQARRIRRKDSTSCLWFSVVVVALTILGCYASVVSITSSNSYGRRRGSLGVVEKRASLSPLQATVEVSATGAATATTAADAGGGGGGGNVIVSLFGYIKESIVRTIDGCGQMWSNHGTCNQIRSKQKAYRSKLQTQWLNEGKMTAQEIKSKLRGVNGGITYEEYDFLVKGKDDRSKLLNIMFLMWGAPRLLPYALMFYPEMLPSPFEFPTNPGANSPELPLEKASRLQSHAVLRTLLNLEKDAHVVPALAKLNFFGRKKQQAGLVQMQTVGQKLGKMLQTPRSIGAPGSKAVLETMDPFIFYKNAEDLSRAEIRLGHCPKSIIKGLASLVDGGGIPNPFSFLTPTFMVRGKLITHIKKIEEADQFLVTEKIDLTKLSDLLLQEACQTRFIGVGVGRSPEELRQALQLWLDTTVVQPLDRLEATGETYNPNMARLVLLGYHALDATRDHRSSSYLPRLLYHGQLQQGNAYYNSNEEEVLENTKGGRK